MTQLSLFDRPAPAAVVPADPNVHPAARRRLRGQALEVLGLLRAGPCTGGELAAISHRFGGRLYDLRKAGCIIKCEQDHATGEATYTLLREPEGLG